MTTPKSIDKATYIEVKSINTKIAKCMKASKITGKLKSLFQHFCYSNLINLQSSKDD